MTETRAGGQPADHEELAKRVRFHPLSTVLTASWCGPGSSMSLRIRSRGPWWPSR
jgi:hypothetical protein